MTVIDGFCAFFQRQGLILYEVHDDMFFIGLSVVGVWFKMAQGHLAVIVRQVWDRIKPKEVLQVGNFPPSMSVNTRSMFESVNGPDTHACPELSGTLNASCL